MSDTILLLVFLINPDQSLAIATSLTTSSMEECAVHGESIVKKLEANDKLDRSYQLYCTGWKGTVYAKQ